MSLEPGYEEALAALPSDACAEGLDLYIREHRPIGDFLTALLSNDLRETFARADSTNKPAIEQYVRFLYQYAPAGTWGSRENVKAWIFWKGSP